MGTKFVAVAIAAAAAFVATPAYAHEGTGLAGGFIAGVLHPLAGLDHMLAMVSVGLWGAFLGRPLVYALPMLFPAAMAFGGALGIAGIGFPPVELGIAISVVTLGAMILFAVRAPVVVACAIVAIFALFHGYAHGTELPSAADPVGYSAGFVLSTGLLHLLGITAGLLRSTPAGTIALRTAGGAIALTGAWFVAGALNP
jgi:urease accessory protein